MLLVWYPKCSTCQRAKRFLEEMGIEVTTRDIKEERLSAAELREGCWLMFGKETAGLPLDLRQRWRDRCLRIPMRADARSLNLANSVAILTYEALRQLGFPHLSGTGEMGQTM